jgi:uncharacterized RDD family membrane protein YckC
MAHDLFISYSAKDKPIADAVCAALEAERIRCWIAPRDVLPGVPYGEALIEALNDSRVLVLVFSSHSNDSPQVMREVERAVSKGIFILPFRIENVPLCKEMEYYISTPHWLDAITTPMEECLARLAQTAKMLLERESHTDHAVHQTPNSSAETHAATAESPLRGPQASAFDMSPAPVETTAEPARAPEHPVPHPWTPPGSVTRPSPAPLRTAPEPASPGAAMSTGTAFGRRLAASVIDAVVVWGLWFVALTAVIGITGVHAGAGATGKPELGSSYGYGLFLLVSLAYCGGMLTTRGQTLGKMALGLRVAGPDGGKPAFWRAALRETVGKLVSSYVLCLGHLWMLWDQKQQTWHDKIAQTRVEPA